MTDTTTPRTAQIVVLPIDQIVPYWRNPRRISDQDIDKVKDSIERYGYQQPIIVDEQHVIITGHTRYQALRRLGWTEVPVLVSNLTALEAKEYRVIDNRTSEYATWDTDKLLLELREFNTDTIDLHFPHIDLNFAYADTANTTTTNDLEEAARRLTNNTAPTPEPTTITIHCPHCHQPITLDT
jgi:ParB-like chromosome segregation protein Spo0J